MNSVTVESIKSTRMVLLRAYKILQRPERMIDSRQQQFIYKIMFKNI